MSPMDAPRWWRKVDIALDRDALLALGAMLLAALLLIAAQLVALHHALRNELRTQGEIVAEMAQAAVVFNDSSDSAALLAPLRAHPAILRARIVDPYGHPLARYERDDAGWHWVDAFWPGPGVTLPIRANGRIVGQVELEACTEPMWRQLSTFAFASGLIMASALWLVSWGSRRLRANVRAAEERRRYLAVHDALTGLTNRDAFQGLLQRWIDAQASGGAGFALLFIDVDSFKRINDTFGHSAGDALLQTVAKRLRAHVRSSDVVARIGGDEFAILLAAPATAETAGRVASAILQEIPQPFVFQGDKVAASVSIGVALYPRDATSGETLLQCADAAMYHAKRLGKNAFEFFSAQIANTLAVQRQLEQDLRGAIDAGQLWLAYQPVFDAHSRIVSVEALVRWNHPQRGTVPPSQFVPAAEDCGLMPELGREIVRIAGRDLQWWRDQGVSPPRVAVNLSSRQFVRDRHGSEFVAMLDALALSPKDVSFELTEGAVFEDLDSPGSVIAQLQRRGYQLALDDFGTGYSSLAYLLRLRCDILKIDRVFVHGSAASKESTLLVAAMVHVAHALGMQVIAEGVEKDEDLAHVQHLGCDAVQGFLLSVPVRREDIARLLQEQRANESVAA